MPNEIARELVRDTPVVREDDPISEAWSKLVESELPAIPVLGKHDKIVGTFGHREFLSALMPAYFKTLPSAGFVPKSLDRTLELRDTCRNEPVSQHMAAAVVKVREDFSDSHVADAFLHNPTEIVAVVDDDGVVKGVITRADFVAGLGSRFFAAE